MDVELCGLHIETDSIDLDYRCSRAGQRRKFLLVTLWNSVNWMFILLILVWERQYMARA
jgi:hypothetical protein